jgi:hypothetical protein
MFCIQSSDAHRVRRAPTGSDAAHRHGIGDRYFEALLPAPTFAALRDLLLSQHFDHVRVPKRDQKEWEIDQLRFGVASERNVLRSAQAAVEDLLQDVAALANTGGGTIVLGASTADQGAVEGISQPDQLSERLRLAVAEAIEPVPTLSFELLRYGGGDVLRIEVRAVQAPPYMMRGGVVFVRRDCETVPAARGEILQLARRAFAEGATTPLDNGQDLALPRSGVEVVSAQRRNGEWQYEIRDLRTTPGIVRERSQGLWAYAIDRHEDLRDGRVDLQAQIKWAGRLGLWRSYRQGNRTKYDLVHRDANGVIDHVFYGVSDWGLSEAWQVLLEDARPSAEIPEDVADPVLMDSSGETSGGLAHGPHGDRPFGDRRCRWQGSMGIWRISRTKHGDPRFDLATRGAGGTRELAGLARDQLNENWQRLIAIRRPATGIEVIADTVGDDGVRRITFRDLRTGDVSAPWQVDELKEGSVREYAARMSRLDLPLDEAAVRWWGNIGYLRPMRSQVDLVYRDANGVDHIYYAARRDELGEEWAALLAQWEDALPVYTATRSAGNRPGERMQPPAHVRGMSSGGRRAPDVEQWANDDHAEIVRLSNDRYGSDA